jgi:hypothetical protein
MGSKIRAFWWAGYVVRMGGELHVNPIIAVKPVRKSKLRDQEVDGGMALK